MKILFEKMRWRNLLSTGQNFIELDLNQFATTLVVGENGAGKSTILDALSYVLFGKPFRKVNKPQLVNTINKKDMLVEIEFSIGTHKYLIRRGIKPAVFEVFKNSKLLNQTAETKDYQEILEKQILKINHKSFCQVVVVGSASFVPFMQLSAAFRREVIEDLLDLQIFTRMNSILKDNVLENGEELGEIASQVKILQELVKTHAEYEKKIQDSHQKMVDEKVQRIEHAVEQRDAAENELALKCLDQTVYTESITDHDSLKAKHSKLLQLKSQIGAKIKTLETEILFYASSDDCPTCRQVIDLVFKTKTLDQKEKEVAKLKKGATDLVVKIIETEGHLEKREVALKKIMDLNLEINLLQSKVANWDKFIQETSEEIAAIEQDMNKPDEAQAAAQKEKLEELTEVYNELSKERTVLSAAGLILKDGGIKASIIKQYIPIINKLINKYLSAMDFYINFELNEEFEETIRSRHRDDFSYASFSEGEKMRINLSLLFAWRAVSKLRNSISTNLLILDEIFDSSLDAPGTDEFIKIVRNLTKDTNTFIISHKTDQFYDKFEHIIRFEKHKNFSQIAKRATVDISKAIE